LKVPGTASLDAGGGAYVSSLSCPSAGNCSVGGYIYGSGYAQAFVADEVNGTWDNAIEVPGTAVLNAGANAVLQSLSCPSAGNCSAGGYYTDSSGHAQVFVADEVNGTWDNAIEMPGTAALNTGANAVLQSLSCPPSRDAVQFLNPRRRPTICPIPHQRSPGCCARRALPHRPVGPSAGQP
jgi:hypothetical protein